MAFGQDWLSDWEAEQEERMVELVPPLKVAPTVEPSSVDLAREVVMSELVEILSPGYARQVSDRIAQRLLLIFGQTFPPKT